MFFYLKTEGYGKIKIKSYFYNLNSYKNPSVEEINRKIEIILINLDIVKESCWI